MTKAESVTRRHLAKQLARTIDITDEKADTMVLAVLGAITQELVNGGFLAISGFGRFETRYKKARIGRNPKTGEDATIPARTIPRFTASKLFKAVVNK